MTRAKTIQNTFSGCVLQAPELLVGSAGLIPIMIPIGNCIHGRMVEGNHNVLTGAWSVKEKGFESGRGFKRQEYGH